MDNRIPEDRLAEDRLRADRAPEDLGPTVINTSRGSRGTGGWAVAVILAVVVAAGFFYFSGAPGDGVDPNATTSAIETPDVTADQPAQTLDNQPADSQPTQGETAQ